MITSKKLRYRGPSVALDLALKRTVVCETYRLRRRFPERALQPCFVALLIAFSALIRVRAQNEDSVSIPLQVSLELASDFDTADPTVQAQILDLVGKEDHLSRNEVALAGAPGETDSHYRRLSPAASAQAVDYLRAFQTSYSRFKDAETAGDRDWSSRQFTATQEYAVLAANALISEARINERDSARLQESSFAVRRPPAQQAIFLQKLTKDGFSEEERKLLHDSGNTDADMRKLQIQFAGMPADQVGRSAVEWLSQIASSRRSLALQLTKFGRTRPGTATGQSSHTFVVGNPHDREELIDLFIRPVSIPPDWKLSITDAEQQPKFKVREIDPGRHYSVTLPARAEVKVASVVVPVGEVGANTTTRWAVEGKIGNELIGGMVHEMNVPYIIPDLQLPPVGSKEVDEELPAAPSRAWARLIAEIAAAIIVFGLLIFFFVFWRRRRDDTPRTP
jgi:hypothetical protein